MECDKKKQFIELFPAYMRGTFGQIAEWIEQVQEVRIRINRPVFFYANGREYTISEKGEILYRPFQALKIRNDDFQKILEHMCGYSIYAYEDEMKQGYLALAGGYRVGLTGKTVVLDGKLTLLKDVNGMNIRIAHEVIGAAEEVLPYLYHKEQILSTLIVSAPGAGKTTLLRDLIRQISDGSDGQKGKNVAVVDERGELAGCKDGLPQCDLGMRTDVLDACPKECGMMMLVRSMAPEVIAVDEIGSERDLEMISYAARSGCSMLATIHATDYEELIHKQSGKRILGEKLFDRIVVLKKNNHPGEIAAIYNGEGEPVCVGGI